MRPWISLCLLVAGLTAGGPCARAAEAVPGPVHAEATVDPAKTSIYIGSVTLDMAPFRRSGERYESTYTARVFPYFFYNEKGRIEIVLSDDDLRQLAAGERITFSGKAESSDGEPRRIEGQATPADPLSGNIKDRVWVSPRIELIFNSHYRFTGR